MRTPTLIAAFTLCLSLSCFAADPTVIDKPAFGKPAPEIAVADLDGNPLMLASLKGKPVVLEFGSLTEPVLRLHAKDVEKLALQFKNKATFLLVYQTEAHPAGSAGALDLNNDDGFATPEATTPDERVKLARELVDKLAIKNETVVVDQWSNATAKRYGTMANMTFLIDAQGNLAAAYPWMDPKKTQGALTELLAGKPISDANMGPGRTQQQALTIPDGLGAQGPGAGVITAAVALDSMTLTDQTRAAVYKPLAMYVAALRNLRDKAAAQAAAQNAAGTQNPKPPVDPAAELQKVADAAKDLKTALKQHLKAEDYQTMTDALNQGVGKQFFAPGTN